MKKSLRILIVEDFKPFRGLIASCLLTQGRSYDVYECSDGLDAVKLALELKPDVITMDIGLPYLNGIEAARKIQETLPAAKILFVTQETAPEILEQARTAGAAGYIHKSQASRGLPSAISAICDGRQADPLLNAFAPLGGSNSREDAAVATQSHT